MTAFPWARAAGLLAVGLSTALAGSRSREAALLGRVLPPPWPPGPCTVLGTSATAAAGTAALWNGTLIHCSDYDDTHQTAVVHPTAAVLPAALAEAESRGSTIGELLLAYACGCESLIRSALAVPGGFHTRGFHATAVCGPVGAAVAAGLLAGDREDVVRAATGIAATLGGGTFEYINSGGNSKIFYPGLAARAGMESMAMARAGAVPPAAALDGAHGLVAAHTGQRPAPGSASPVVLGTGEPDDGWRFVETAVKSYPCCYFSQVFLDALASLRDRLDPAAIDRIECHGPRELLGPVCHPRDLRARPQDPYDAKFALPFQLAAMVVSGRVDHATFSSASLADPEIAALAARVVPVHTDELGRYPASMPGRVRVVGRDGELGTAELAASLGAGRWELGSGFLTDRLNRDLGALAGPLADALSDLDAPVGGLAAVVRGWREPDDLSRAS